MSQVAGENRRRSSVSVGALLRSLGRVAIWALLGLLLVRGAGAVLAGPRAAERVGAGEDAAAEQASGALAVRFARVFLADPEPRALAPFMVEGARLGAARPPADSGEGVAQAEVASTEELGGGRAILTVACELRDGRTVYVAVPIVRSRAGEAAALGAPSIVAAPGVVGADPEQPRPLAGAGAAQIRRLLARFLPDYLRAGRGAKLSYLLAPGAGVEPLAGAVRFLSLRSLAQLGAGEGPRRTVLAAVRVEDPTSGASYPLVYRVEVARRGRWYVSAVEGELP